MQGYPIRDIVVSLANVFCLCFTDLSETPNALTPRTSSRSPAGKSYNVLRGYMEYFAVCLLSALLSRESRSSSLVLVESLEKMMEDPKCTKDVLICKIVLE
ncbi:hypothetical protein CTI12_AA559850 [Artemisia annua]|uniref:Uncharacterized protein n=1 Tax=Artemisia annua TaxID=35608 RepID=A0A2U1KVD6_ARTAN|nr:hypothetical protein CTI12_AA559850 [Artemisia annua]